MKPGRSSKTAELVCMGRALAHLDPPVSGFSDPTAMELLPAIQRARIERMLAGERARGLGEWLRHWHLRLQASVMAVRTVAIDDAVRERGAPQLVVLGAGLDGRAWRLPELADTVVFEVDHPDTQRTKRERVARLTRTAREVRFVPVDFTRDDLATALAGADHDPDRPTTWVWEGVVMYLTREATETTLSTIARRSAPGSRLVVAYHSPAAVLWAVDLVVRRLGEPLRSTFTPGAFAELVGRYGFRVSSDRSIAAIGATLGERVARATRPIKHFHIAVADV